MNKTPSSAALESIDFPTRYALKVLGNRDTALEAMVLKLIQARCPQAEPIEMRQRISKNGTYVALTLTFMIESHQQLKEIYQDLYICEDVVMSL